MGLITPLGIGIEETWTALCAGKSGITEITKFDASPHLTQIAAEVKGFNAEDFMAKKEARRNELFISYALAATRMALEDAALEINSQRSH
jgi:3-oxoacyl-[acyl-carrier-protein] synthase II